MRAPKLALAAAAVLAVEGVALAAVAAVEVAGLLGGDASSTTTAAALVVLTVIGSAALVAFARGTRLGRSWARSGAIVFQVLAVVVALASLTLHPVPWLFALMVGAPGILGFALVIASARREGEQRPLG